MHFLRFGELNILVSSVSVTQPRLQSTAQHGNGNDTVVHNTARPVLEQHQGLGFYDEFTLSDLEAAFETHDVEEAVEVVPVEVVPVEVEEGEPTVDGPCPLPSPDEPGLSGGEPSGNGPSPLPSSGEPGPSGGEPSGNGLSPPQSPGEPGPSSGSGLSCGGSSLPADFRFGLDRAPPPGWRRSKRAWERCMFKKRRKRGGKKMRENVSF